MEETVQKQMSETFLLSAILAFSGGFQDAYTYNMRDHVFSNAQTGNIVLMSQYCMMGEYGNAFSYLLPILAFSLGIFVTEGIRKKYRNQSCFHWRQFVVLIEMAALFLVGFIPLNYNLLATTLVSFSCAMQVQAFRKVNGYGYASTMCIGNLRSGTEALFTYISDKKKEACKKVAYYYGIILVFAIGAGIGGILSLYIGIRTIWCCCLVLGVSCFLMEKNP